MFEFKACQAILTNFGLTCTSDVECTVLMFLLLETKYSDKQDEYFLMFEKSVGWLQAQG